MNKYKAVKRGNVCMYIIHSFPKTYKQKFKKLFTGIRTLYKKDNTENVYVRYKNKYYTAHYHDSNTYVVIINNW